MKHKRQIKNVEKFSVEMPDQKRLIRILFFFKTELLEVPLRKPDRLVLNLIYLADIYPTLASRLYLSCLKYLKARILKEKKFIQKGIV